jgi:RNA polymerase sigma-70 factor (ECF subfamily)
MFQRMDATWDGAWTIPVTEPSDRRSVLSGAEAGRIDATLESVPDGDLARAAAAGDRAAFGVLVERHRRSVYRLCYRFAGTHEDASDLAQDVFVRAFRGLRGFKAESAFSTWLYRIAVNVCLNRVSSKAPRLEPLVDENYVDPSPLDPVHSIICSQRRASVRAAIARLPARQRSTVILRVYQECSHQEIAKVLGSSVGTAKANFFHALNNLRKLLAPDE